MKCIDICIKVLPYTNDMEFSPIAKYDNISYMQSIYMNLYNKKIYNTDKTCDIDTTCYFHEIVNYVKTEEFAKRYKVHDKAGILFLHNGYPIFGFENHLSHSNQNFIIIDINNYIFNKKIMFELNKIERVQKRNKMYFEIIVVLGITVIAVSCFILFCTPRHFS